MSQRWMSEVAAARLRCAQYCLRTSCRSQSTRHVKRFLQSECAAANISESLCKPGCLEKLEQSHDVAEMACSACARCEKCWFHSRTSWLGRRLALLPSSRPVEERASRKYLAAQGAPLPCYRRSALKVLQRIYPQRMATPSQP